MRRSFSHRGLVAAMEAEDLLPEAVETGEVADLANSQEEGLTEIAEDEAGLEQHDALIDEAVDTAEALESLRENLKASLESGGLDKMGAAILRDSLAFHYKRMGMNVPRVAPALESFGSIGRREDATKIALEEVGEQAKKIWDSIVAAIQKAIDWIKQFVVKLFDSNKQMVARAQELKERANKMEAGAQAAEKTIKNAGIAGQVQVAGKVDGVAAAGELHKVAADVIGKYSGWAQALSGPMSNLGDPAALFNAVNMSTIGLGDVHDAASQGISAPDGAKVGRSAELPGGKALVVVVSKDAAGSDAKMLPFNKAAAEFKGEEAPILNKEQMIQVADQIIALGKIIDDGKTAVAASEKGKGELMNAVKQEQGKAEGADAAIKNARAILKLVDAPFVALTSTAVKAGKALNQLVEQSILAHGAKKEEPAAAPAAAEKPAAAPAPAAA
ncbi:hypothetical protein [Paraburkholderia sp. BCC1886]|uniref:hypothetical protein n=1 Tax=Paraburkholderia sp. BCC1886 TaxID=2562670 RepID=UPI00118285FB|nr:hypothetical protein [Paraburkholderia sp. BCC1886]